MVTTLAKTQEKTMAVDIKALREKLRAQNAGNQTQ